MSIDVPAGRCDICSRYVDRLWITVRFILYCAGCVDEGFAAAAAAEPDEDDQ